MRGPAGDVDVPAFWAGLGLPGLVDVHVHFLPERMLAKVWAYFDRGEENYGTPWPVAYRWPEPERLAHLRAMGVRRFTALVYPHKPGMSRWLNDWALGFAAAAGPDVVAAATFYPEPGAAEYLREALERGAGVVKVHVQVGDFDPRDPLLREVWGLLAEAAVPVVVHCGSGPTPGRFTGPDIFAEVLAEHPQLTAVVAHMGMPEWSGFLDLAQRYERVHLDTTMAFTDFAERRNPFPPGELARVRDLGAKVVLGSDFPNIPHSYAHQLDALTRLDLGDEWLRAVCWDNGARLLGMPADAGADRRSP